MVPIDGLLQLRILQKGILFFWNYPFTIMEMYDNTKKKRLPTKTKPQCHYSFNVLFCLYIIIVRHCFRRNNLGEPTLISLAVINS